MSVFQDIKELLSFRQVVEYYGLNPGKGNRIKCPFHPDKTPSMYIYKDHYHCFGCNAHGDLIEYVAQLFGFSPYDAALKIIEDFSLPVDIRSKDPVEFKKERLKWKQKKKDREKIRRIKDHFRKWCNESIDRLHKVEKDIAGIKDHYSTAAPDEVFSSEKLAIAVNAEPVIGYWLDILCMGTEDERIRLFTEERKEVDCYVDRVSGAVEENMEGSRTDTGYGIQQRRRNPA